MPANRDYSQYSDEQLRQMAKNDTHARSALNRRQFASRQAAEAARAAEDNRIKDAQNAATGVTPYYTPYVSVGVNQVLNQMPTIDSYFDENGKIKNDYLMKDPMGKGGISEIYYKNGKLDPSMLMANPADVKTGANYAAGQSMLDQLTGTANSAGLTSHAQALFDQQRLGEESLRDNAETLANRQGNANLDMLAALGGFNSGARERAMSNAQRDKMFALQGVAREGELARLGIRSDDEAYKKDLQSQLVRDRLGYDQYSTDMQFKNIGNDMAANQFNAGQSKSVLDTLADARFKTNTANMAANAALKAEEDKNKWKPWEYTARAVSGQAIASA